MTKPIEVFAGPMNSGKSRELITCCYEQIKSKFLSLDIW